MWLNCHQSSSNRALKLRNRRGPGMNSLRSSWFPNLMHKSLSGLALCPWPLGISPRFSHVASQGACGSPASAGWVVGGKTCNSPGNKLLRPVGTRVTAGSLARCLPARCAHCHPLSPAMESRVGCMGASWQRQGCSHSCGTGRAGARLDKASCPQKPVRANHNHWHLQPQRSRAFLTGLPLWPSLPDARASP